MSVMAADNFCLRWNDFAENVSSAFKDLRTENDFFDVTLACSDSALKTLQAHKVILSACSNVFKDIFRKQSNAQNLSTPYIYMRGITYNNLASILDFIYNGEVNVAQKVLNSFLAIAEELQIKGLIKDRSTNSIKNPQHSLSSNDYKTQTGPIFSDRDQSPLKKVRKYKPDQMAITLVSKPNAKPINV